MGLAKEGTQPCVHGRMKPEELTSGKRKYLGDSSKAVIKSACVRDPVCLRCKADTGPNKFPGSTTSQV